MDHYSKAPLGDGALPDSITGFAGSANAVAAYEDSTPVPTPSTLNACLVDVLRPAFELSSTIARCLGCSLWWLLPWPQEA
jgi:hypothetical protein